ncbi:HNH endonuclease [Vibrio splendidus]|nr:Endonuclease [Vibrio chagasii]
MKKIDLPAVTPLELYDSCLQAMRAGDFKTRLENGKNEYQELSSDYITKGQNGRLSEILNLQSDEDNPIVAFNVRKDEFKRLYEYHLRDKGKPSRHFYDAIMLAAKEKCPFCGGLGMPTNLDHYLPKAHFPQFSIVPYNLIPACMDCNMGEKGDAFAVNLEDQVLHPYLDKDLFFNEQWIFGAVIPGPECSINFVSNPPENWDPVDISRVNKHFSEFGLAKKYRLQATDELTVIIYQRRKFMSNFSVAQFQEFLIDQTEVPLPPNHWRKVFYKALANDHWFCSEAHL